MRRRNLHIHLTADYDPSEARKGKGPGGGQWTKGGGSSNAAAAQSAVSKGGAHEFSKAEGQSWYARLAAAPQTEASRPAGAREYAEEERRLQEEEEAEENAAGFREYPQWRKGGEQAVFGGPRGRETHIHIHKPGAPAASQGPPQPEKWTGMSLAGAPFTHGGMSGELSKLNETRDDPNLTSEQVAASVPASQMSELLDTRAHIERDKRMRGDTQKRYKTDPSRASGYSKDRNQLHRAIILHGRRGIDADHPGQTKQYEGLLSREAVARAKPEPGQQPELTLLGGRGGSGKSWFKDKLYDSKHALVLDADTIKHMLPEYTGDNAWEVHEESSDILERVMKAAKRRGLNIVMDATMKTGPTLMKRANDFKKAGYKVNAHYMHLPRLKAAQRAIDRRFSPGIESAQKGGDPSLRGRYVDPDVILSNKDNEKNFEALSHIVDNWSAWDNDVPRGASPKLIARGGNY